MLLCCALFGAQQVKVIDLSWSNPTISFLEKHLAEMEKDSPLDGITVRIGGKQMTAFDKTYTPGLGNAWNKRPWSFEAFDTEIKRYKALKFTKFTDNFFYMTTSVVDFDWCSDEDWKTVAANFGVAAKVAKAMGLKGLLVDIEEYGKKFWKYGDDVHPKDISFDDLEDVVFKRGQQWGRAIFAEYPDIVLFMPFCITMGSGASLSISFMNGVLDVIPPTALIYEGNESAGYAAKSPQDYTHMQSVLRRLIKQKIRPENQIKARAQLLLSPAFYLDAHWTHEPKSIYYQNLMPEMEEQGKLNFFIRNFLGAMSEADPYIWVYGEQRCWWKGSPHPRVQGTWDEAKGAEGISHAIRRVKGEESIVVKPEANLAKDPHFTGKGNAWSLWQREQDQKKPIPGSGEIKDGRAVARKCTNGCFNQTIPIKPNTFYLFSVKGGFLHDGGIAGGALCFKSKDNKWLSNSNNLFINFPKHTKEGVCQGYILSPANAGFVSIQCSISSQGNTGEAYFTEVSLTEL